MYTLLVISTLLVCLVRCEGEMPASVQPEPAVQPALPDSVDVPLPAVQPEPVLPAAVEVTTLPPAIPVEKDSPPASNGSVDLSVSFNNDNGTLPVVPNAAQGEHPELSARKQSVPGLADISPDSARNILGGYCKDDSDCLVKETICKGKSCVCRDGYRPSIVKLEACVLIPRSLNDSCESNSDCDSTVKSSECINNKCSCPPNFVADQGACWESKDLGSVCQNNIQCAEILNAACLQGVCACPVEFVPSPTSNKCLQRSKGYQFDCIEDIQCTETMGDSAKCQDLKCICHNEFHYNGSKCIADRALGAPCETKDDCIISALPGTNESVNQRTCLNNTCSCAAGFRVSKGEDSCVKGAADQISISLAWMVCMVIAKYLI